MATTKTIALIQARVSSTRLPGKVLKKIQGMTLLEYQLKRVCQSKYIDKIIVVTSDDSSDDEIASLCESIHQPYFRGSLENVLDRFYQSIKDEDCENIVRLTGDCPVIDPKLIDDVIRLHIKDGNDYTANCLTGTYPDGMDTEVFTKLTLTKAWEEAKTVTQKEHVTPYINTNPQIFKVSEVKNSINQGKYRFTVDEPEDFDVIAQVANHFAKNISYSCDEIIEFVDKNKLFDKNAKYKRNEGLEKSKKEDMKMKLKDRYEKSTKNYHNIAKIIPLASQTFSKSVTQFSLGTSPLFATKGKGARLWDIDGNEYIDFVNALLSVNLGYRYEEVDVEVISQIQNSGVNFSLPHKLEEDVARKIIEMVPCAEMVRFGKNGTDVTSAAIRLSRAYTGRKHIAVCGYHGWQDWYIGRTTMNKGVPEVTAGLTTRFDYNNIASLEKIFVDNPSDVAAVIMEPMNVEYPANNFLQEVQSLAKKHGAVLIFDEMITGFRFANGGAQEYFGVTPDLATFGKGMANGYPLSAIVGKKEIMSEMNNIFFSGTFGGETVALAAANKVLDILKKDSVVDYISRLGSELSNKLQELISEKKLENIFSVKGHPSWTFLIIQDSEQASAIELKSLLLQEMLRRGILTIGTHNISFSHTDSDVNYLIESYGEYFEIVLEALKNGDIKSKIEGDVIRPLFKVR